MGITEMLDELKSKARRDPALREELLETRKDSQPLSAFCRKCREVSFFGLCYICMFPFKINIIFCCCHF